MRGEPYFRPGDKVMRVGSYPATERTLPYDGSLPQFGVVYCVEDFWEGPTFNAVMLVGFGGWRYHPINGTKVGWRASAFRKVDEIKLCVAAANHAKASQQTVEA